MISTTSWLTHVLPRLIGKSSLLHVIFVPVSGMNDYAVDMSEVDPKFTHTQCWEGERVEVHKRCREMAQTLKEVVLDRTRLDDDVVVKTFDSSQILKDLFPFIQAKDFWCEYENGGDMAALLSKESMARKALLQRLETFMELKLLGRTLHA